MSFFESEAGCKSTKTRSGRVSVGSPLAGDSEKTLARERASYAVT